MFGRCLLCRDLFSEKVEENVGNGNTKITWSQWVNESGRSQKKEFQEVLTKQLVC